MDDGERALFGAVVRDGAAALGVVLGDEQIAAFARHAVLLEETNRHTNLTRITRPDAVAAKHFVDSLSLLRACPDLPADARVADVGTGAGFPGLPLKIVQPRLRVTLIDALQKRLGFLAQVVADLQLENVLLLHARAEDAGRNPAHRDRYDLVVARAVAALPTLLEWCTPLVRVGGRFVAMKSEAADAELADAQAIEQALRVERTGDVSLVLPAVEGEAEGAQRRLLIFSKTGPTPRHFPRSAANRKANH